MNLFFLLCSLFSLLAFILFPLTVFSHRKIRPNDDNRLTAHWLWCIMTAISAFFWFFPFFWVTDTANNEILKFGKVFFSSVQALIRIFAVEDFIDLYETISEFGLSTFVLQCYTFIGILLHLLAPVLTFGFILAIFKNVHAYFRYSTFFGKEIHVFSELNEKSLALARSLLKEKDEKKKNRKMIIFADILDKNEEEHLDLVANAKDINAILFRQDITAIRFKSSAQKKFFYLISENESEKIMHMEHIISKYKDVPDTKLYVFSDEEESKCFLESYPNAEKEAMKLDVIRINDIRSLIYHNLDENGLRLFERSIPCKFSNERIIHAAIVGFGKYGKEMIKALLWYAQLPGYRLKLTVFDENKDGTKAEDIFKGLCPDLKIDKAVNDENDMRYEIHFEACKEGTGEFYEKLGKLKDLTYVFIALGKDSLNIAASMGIRNCLAKYRRYPDVETIVYDSKLKKRISTDWNRDTNLIFKGMEDIFAEIQKNCSELKKEGVYPNITDMADSLISDIRSAAQKLSRLRLSKEEYSQEGQAFFADAKGSAKDFKDKCKEVQENGGESRFADRFTALTQSAGRLASLFDRPYHEIHQIHIIGDLESFYSAETVIGSELIADGASVHHRYCSADTFEKKRTADKTFYMDDYNFCSSVSKALHARLRVKIIEKLEKEKDDPHTQEIFFAFIPPESSDEKSPWNHPYACNRFVLKNTAYTDGAMRLHNKWNSHLKDNRIKHFKPFQLTEAQRNELKQTEDFHFGKETFKAEDLTNIAKSAAYIEHVRWNAYMRSEGFSFTTEFKKDWDKPLNLHGDLKVCEELTFNDINKDI